MFSPVVLGFINVVTIVFFQTTKWVH